MKIILDTFPYILVTGLGGCRAHESNVSWSWETLGVRACRGNAVNFRDSKIYNPFVLGSSRAVEECIKSTR